METKQITFIVFMLVMLGVFGYTIHRLWGFIGLTKAGFPIDKIGERINLTLKSCFWTNKNIR